MFSSILMLFLLSFILTTLLIFAFTKWRVDENPLVNIVDEILPQANCGACGYPGCHAFAEALANKQTQPGKCNVSSPGTQEKIAHLLSVDIGDFEKQVARLACAGGNNVAKNHADYSNVDSCRAAAFLGGGAKNCSWGCLGLGDCEKTCQFHAISMSANLLPVVDENRCTACNDCVEICPRDLFSLQAISQRLWVACKNPLIGDELLDSCDVACTACGRCAHDAGDKWITMVQNLPVIDYTYEQQTKIAIERCPTGAIVWFAENGKTLKGKEAKAIIRQSPKLMDYS